MANGYVYPVVFSPAEEGGFSVYAPDFEGCVTDAEDYADGLAKIRDGLCGMIYVLERDGRTVPAPTNFHEVRREDGDVVTLVDAPIADYERKLRSRKVKRTVSIPEWLDDLAVRANVSLSQITQDALVRELGI